MQTQFLHSDEPFIIGCEERLVALLHMPDIVEWLMAVSAVFGLLHRLRRRSLALRPEHAGAAAYHAASVATACSPRSALALPWAWPCFTTVVQAQWMGW